MSEEFRINHTEVAKLGKSFGTYAYDLERYASAFEEAAAADAIRDGVGAEAGDGYTELAERMVATLGHLNRRLDAIGGALGTAAESAEASDEALAREWGRHISPPLS
ncbi:WXG100 family type VII secretion target [Actinacidiphila soli]|uniref:WXG100 family type VII secretion target n=1 Tax=Actinacidiphila soli TaxID=2487275 RepID=UPI000FCB09EA|nr:hypothetical protein [Actinacidiphila soli]